MITNYSLSCIVRSMNSHWILMRLSKTTFFAVSAFSFWLPPKNEFIFQCPSLFLSTHVLLVRSCLTTKLTIWEVGFKSGDIQNNHHCFPCNPSQYSQMSIANSINLLSFPIHPHTVCLVLHFDQFVSLRYHCFSDVATDMAETFRYYWGLKAKG